MQIDLASKLKDLIYSAIMELILLPVHWQVALISFYRCRAERDAKHPSSNFLLAVSWLDYPRATSLLGQVGTPGLVDRCHRLEMKLESAGLAGAMQPTFDPQQQVLIDVPARELAQSLLRERCMVPWSLCYMLHIIEK